MKEDPKHNDAPDRPSSENEPGDTSELQDQQLDEAAGGTGYRHVFQRNETNLNLSKSKPLLIIAEDIEGEAL